MICVRGANSEIVKRLQFRGAKVHPVERNAPMPLGCQRYLFCQGMIRPKHITLQMPYEIQETFWANAGYVIRECERLIAENRDARICIVGSDSGFKWSYDGAYAASKAALHKFIECKRLKHPNQQLVGVAPSCICDTQSVQGRGEDGRKALDKRLENHPKQRWIKALEVANMIYHLMYVDEGYTTGVVIRMNGGEHCGDRW